MEEATTTIAAAFAVIGAVVFIWFWASIMIDMFLGAAGHEPIKFGVMYWFKYIQEKNDEKNN